MQLDRHTGTIKDATWIPSPNNDVRPDTGFINCLIIHSISLPPKKFGGNFVEDLFCNQLDKNAHPYFESICNLRVSAHFYIRRNGALCQFVATHKRAWHAGISSYKGLDQVNDFSIGIELEGHDLTGYTDAQYRTLIKLIKCLRGTYPAISNQRIVGHCDIAPGRKTDPGPYFDWQYLLNEV